MAQPNTAETPVDVAALQASAKAEGAKDERARIKAIMENPESQGREGLAKTLAFETDMAPDAAQKVMASSPKQEVKTANPLHAAMATVQNPKVGAAGERQEPTTQDLVNEALALAGAKKKG